MAGGWPLVGGVRGLRFEARGRAKGRKDFRFRRHVLRRSRCRGLWQRIHGRGGDGALVVGAGREAGIEKRRRVIVLDLCGESGRGKVDGGGLEQVGREGKVADDLFFVGLGNDLEPFAVCRGELQPIEEGVRAFGVDEVAGERVEDLGKGELNSNAVFERRERDDVTALHQALRAYHSGAVKAMAFVKTAVEVTEVRVLERDGATLDAVGLDVTTQVNVHDSLLCGSPLPPGGRG